MFKILTCVLEMVDVFWCDAPDGVIEGVEATGFNQECLLLHIKVTVTKKFSKIYIYYIWRGELRSSTSTHPINAPVEERFFKRRYLYYFCFDSPLIVLLY